MNAFRPHQPATAMLGTDRHQARGRLPAHSRIHLFVRRGLSEGWDLCLSDHAEIGYGVLSGLPHRPVAKVCQAGYPLGSRRRPQPSLQRPRASRQYLATLPPAILARAQPEGKSLGRNSGLTMVTASRMIPAVRINASALPNLGEKRFRIE